jgi:glycerol-3-phosphate acyltransferase PlsY
VPVLAILIAYLLGSIPFGFLLVRSITGKDVRASGSGNIGATNVFRTTSRWIGVLTLVLDAAKAWVAVLIADRLTHSSLLWMSAAAVAALLGHIFPLFLRFHGGKAVASCIGAFLYLTPVAIAAVTVVFVVAVWRTKFISLGSILAAATFPLAVWIIQRPALPVVAASILASALIIWRHQANIARLHAGTESVFSFRRSRS